MAILISYNGYIHPQGEVAVSVNRQSLYTDADTIYAERVRVTLNGTMVASSTTEMDARFRALVTAYAYDGGDFVMMGGPASLALSPSMYSANTIGGVRVVKRPSMADGRNAAYVTFLNYQIVLEGLFPVSNPLTYLRSFREQISFSGGGKVYGTLETRTGKGERQLWTKHAIYRAEQRGVAVGLYSPPTVPDPIWPRYLIRTPEITRDGGHFTGDVAFRTWISGGKKRSATLAGAMDYSATWRYLYEATSELQGDPNTSGDGGES